MLGDQNARGQTVRGIIRQNRDAGLTKDRSIVQHRRDQMNAGTRLGVARLDRTGMGVKPRVLGQQRWVDVQHASRKAIDEGWGQDTHKARKADDIGLGRKQRLKQSRLKRRPVTVEWMMIHCGDWNATRLGLCKTASGRVV